MIRHFLTTVHRRTHSIVDDHMGFAQQLKSCLSTFHCGLSCNRTVTTTSDAEQCPAMLVYCNAT